MAEPMRSDELRVARIRAALSQTELARRSGVPQPNISAYEAGLRVPRPETAAKLLDALKERPSAALRRNRDGVLHAAAANKIRNVRVFGSVAEGTDSPNSDLDLLVTPAEDASALDLAGFMADLRDLLGVRVDVVSDRGTSEFVRAMSRRARTL